MSNPFDLLGEPNKKKVEEFELVSGAFGCQHTGCFSTVGEAKYFQDAKLLTWKCKEEHINKIMDFEF